jgi:hypothetical protein
MVNQAQVDAVEQLLMAVMKAYKFRVDAEQIFDNASSALMGEDGPPGTEQKIQAANYLAHLRRQLK